MAESRGAERPHHLLRGRRGKMDGEAVPRCPQKPRPPSCIRLGEVTSAGIADGTGGAKQCGTEAYKSRRGRSSCAMAALAGQDAGRAFLGPRRLKVSRSRWALMIKRLGPHVPPSEPLRCPCPHPPPPGTPTLRAYAQEPSLSFSPNPLLEVGELHDEAPHCVRGVLHPGGKGGPSSYQRLHWTQEPAPAIPTPCAPPNCRASASPDSAPAAGALTCPHLLRSPGIPGPVSSVPWETLAPSHPAHPVGPRRGHFATLPNLHSAPRGCV